MIETVRKIKREWDIDVIAGNVATSEGCRDLIAAGADAVKVGIGPGSICTTRVISGVGVPQVSAIFQAAQSAKESGTPIIADGGIRYSGDITKALAAGAHSVMIGGLFAGLDESPGQRILFHGRVFKAYRGMGSMKAMVQGSGERYRQGEVRKPDKLVPEGVEGRVPYKGPLGPFVYQLVGGLRAGMGYCGTGTIDALRTDTQFIQVSAASVRESHPHDIAITQECQITARNMLSKKPSTSAGRVLAIALGLMVGIYSPLEAGESVITLVSYSTGQNGSQLKWRPSRSSDSGEVKQAAAIGQIGDSPSKAPENVVPPGTRLPFSDPFQDKGGATVLQPPKVNQSPAAKRPFDLGPALTEPKKAEGSTKITIDAAKSELPAVPPLELAQAGDECPKLGVELKSLTKTRRLGETWAAGGGTPALVPPPQESASVARPATNYLHLDRLRPMQ